tara:strand:- start:107 stop:367 length:261 start_codon:yes stop_codon:yes gene_type:complete
VKNKLKYEKRIVIDRIILLMLLLNKMSKLFTDKNPPEEIIVNEKLKASKVLRLINFNSRKITNVSKEYKIITFNDCLKTSDELKVI